MISYSELKSKGVGFIAFKEEQKTLAYTAFNLAEGLHELGIPVLGMDQYTQDKKVSDFELPAAEPVEKMKDLSYYIISIITGVDDSFVETEIPLNGDRCAIFDMSDGIADYIIKTDAAIYGCHSNRFYKIPGKRHPHAFGISKKMEELSLAMSESQPREPIILCNFRPSNSQSVRESLEFTVVENLERSFFIDRELDDGRYCLSYYERLKKYSACLAYGGKYGVNFLKNPYFSKIPLYNNFFSKIRFGKDPLIHRWDSWRFWESLAMGCATITLDMEKYGFELPVMPENWVHYIGLDLSNLERDLTRIKSSPELLREIGEAGRLWVLEHYTPRAVARRFIKDICHDYEC